MQCVNKKIFRINIYIIGEAFFCVLILLFGLINLLKNFRQLNLNDERDKGKVSYLVIVDPSLVYPSYAILCCESCCQFYLFVYVGLRQSMWVTWYGERINSRFSLFSVRGHNYTFFACLFHPQTLQDWLWDREIRRQQRFAYILQRSHRQCDIHPPSRLW